MGMEMAVMQNKAGFRTSASYCLCTLPALPVDYVSLSWVQTTRALVHLLFTLQLIYSLDLDSRGSDG